jgi:ribosome-associated protein
MQDDDFDNDAADGAETPERAPRPNKEQLKRETQALKELVQHLLDLPASRLDTMPVEPHVREQIRVAGKMERGALKRQIKYIVGLLRDSDTELLERELQRLSQAQRQQVQHFHEIERWRDELLDGNEALIDELVGRFAAERQRLRQLVRNARRERGAGKPPKSARLLFRYLNELREQA